MAHQSDTRRNIVHYVKKVPGIDHSKSLLKEIVKNLFNAKLAPLPSILTWSSNAICHLFYVSPARKLVFTLQLRVA